MKTELLKSFENKSDHDRHAALLTLKYAAKSMSQAEYGIRANVKVLQDLLLEYESTDGNLNAHVVGGLLAAISILNDSIDNNVNTLVKRFGVETEK